MGLANGYKTEDEHRKTSNIIFTNRRLRRFFRMIIDHVQTVLEKKNGQTKDHKDSQGG